MDPRKKFELFVGCWSQRHGNMSSRIGPQVKSMTDLDLFIWAIMGQIIVTGLPEPCRGDLRGC